MAEDLHRLLHPRAVHSTHPQLLAGPLFTSVPPLSADLEPGAFVSAIAEQEDSLRALLAERLASSAYAARVGVGAVRAALAPQLALRWGQMLAATSHALDARIGQLERELHAPPPPPPAESLDDFAERFSSAIQSLIKGTIAVSAAEHGET